MTKTRRPAKRALHYRESGYARLLLLGVPGSGKTTYDRQLMGSHPENDVFRPTSVNRTTTFPIETIFRPGHYRAVVTFLSEQMEQAIGTENSL